MTCLLGSDKCCPPSTCSSTKATRPHDRDLVREDLIEEALRLCRLLLDNPSTLPNVHALMALMVYHAARSDARVDTHGEIILLQDLRTAPFRRPGNSSPWRTTT